MRPRLRSGLAPVVFVAAGEFGLRAMEYQAPLAVEEREASRYGGTDRSDVDRYGALRSGNAGRPRLWVTRLFL